MFQFPPFSLPFLPERPFLWLTIGSSQGGLLSFPALSLPLGALRFGIPSQGTGDRLLALMDYPLPELGIGPLAPWTPSPECGPLPPAGRGQGQRQGLGQGGWELDPWTLGTLLPNARIWGMPSAGRIVEKVLQNRRISPEEALELLNCQNLALLGRAADHVRRRKHPQNLVSFLIDRNINYTNVCLARCSFCNFYRKPKHEEGYVLSKQEIFSKIEETLELGGTGILMQGGMNPDLKIDYYEDLLSSIRERYEIHLHCFSPPEIVVLARISKLSLRETIQRLVVAGLHSIPGGGAEILTEPMRDQISPGKCSAQEWLEVMRVAHQEGLVTTATMMIGGGETWEERVEHLDRLRRLQDETSGFVAFIPWNVQLEGTPMQKDINREVSAVEYIRMLAVSRIFFDNIHNIQVSWLTQGLQVAQIALHFGANDVGSIMIEENVISTAGAHNTATSHDLIGLIEAAGFIPAQRDTLYRSFRKIA